MIKLLLVSGVGCLAWNFLVKPAHEKVNQQRQTLESHRTLIEAYNTQVGSQDIGSSVELERQLGQILGSITSAMDGRDSDTSLHSLLNESAEHAGISISRIESIKAGEVRSKAPQSEEWVEGVNHTVRVELDGSYGSVIAFMNEIVSSPTPVVFTSVRVLPMGIQRVRVNAEINSVMLTSIPASIQQGGIDHE